MFVATVSQSANTVTPTLNITSPDSQNLKVNGVTIDGIINYEEYKYRVVISHHYPWLVLYYTIVRSTIYIGLSAQGVGWVSMGYGGYNKMEDYDIITGGFDSATNTSYIYDAYTIGKVVPPVDAVHNYNEFAATERPDIGYTYLEFSRELNTGDTDHDKVLIPGKPMYAIFALQTTSDDIGVIHDMAEREYLFVFYGPPAAPENLTATATRNQVMLNWSAPLGDGGYPIANYTVFRSEDNGQTFTAIATTNDTYFVDTTVTTGVIYQYKVTATNSEGESGDSNIAITLPLGDITPPQSVTSTSGSFAVNLSWSYPQDDGGIPVVQYNIYRSQTSGGPYTLIGSNTSVLGFTDTSAINGFTYYYVVTALNKYNESAYSSEVVANPVGEPTSPLNIEAINGDNTATLNWTEPISDGGYPITHYNVYRSQAPGGPYTFIGTNTSTTGFFDTGVVNGQTYYYVVTAVNSFGESAYSDEQRLLIANTPLAPTNLNGTFGNQQVILTWNSADGRGFEVTNYTVYRKDPGASAYVAIATVNTTSFTDTGLVNGQTYRYVVTAHSIVGESPYSAFFEVTPATVPAIPENLTITLRNSKVMLSWSKPADNGGFPVLYYNIYRSEGSADNFALYDYTYGKSYLDSKADFGKTYYYRVTAMNTIGESAPSEAVSIFPASSPSSPQNLRAVLSDGSIVLEWDAPSDDGGSPVVYYRIYRSTVENGIYVNVGVSENLSYVDDFIRVGATYYYMVTAVNIAGESSYSPEISIQYVTPPATPTELVALASEELVTLAWVSTSEDHSPATHFEVYRAANGSDEFTLVGTTNKTYFIDRDVQINVTYSYYVVAVNDYGKSDPSTIVEATPGDVSVSIPPDLLEQAGESEYPNELNTDVISATAAIFSVIGVIAVALRQLKAVFFP